MEPSKKAADVAEGVKQAVEEVKKQARKLTISLAHSNSGDYAMISVEVVRKLLKELGIEFGKAEVEEIKTERDTQGLTAHLRLKLPAEEKDN